MTAGYSGTPLWKKLGLKDGQIAAVINAPSNYNDLLGISRPDFRIVDKIEADLTFYHLFSTERAELTSWIQDALSLMVRDGVIWASWPKKVSKVPTDITEDAIREIIRPTELVDVKVCAVDETWSGLKLVIRKELR